MAQHQPPNPATPDDSMALLKVIIPVGLAPLLPEALTVLPNTSPSYLERLYWVFVFSGELFAFGPLRSLAQPAEHGNLLAVVGLNAVPVTALAVLLFLTLARSQTPWQLRLSLSVLWAIVIVETVGTIAMGFFGFLLLGTAPP